jgi:hypothetical protein
MRLHVNEASTKRGSEQVWCFDKNTQKVFSPNIRGVLAGTRFYEVEVNGETLSLEELLSEIEGLLAPILGRLVREPKLASLSKRTVSPSPVSVRRRWFEPRDFAIG